MTVGGVEWNLEISPYTFMIQEGFILYFSSKLHMMKYRKNYEEYIKRKEKFFKKNYCFNVDMTISMALKYYEKIETRGFFVYDSNDKREYRTFEDFNWFLDYF